MLPARCAAANSSGSRVSRICAPLACNVEHVVERERIHFAREGLVERGPLFAVQHGVVVEVGRGFGLIGGHDLDEGVLAHGLQRVIQTALFAEGGDCFFAERFAAERARAVCRVDQALRRAEPAAFCAANRRACRRVRLADHPSAARRSGRPTSPMNNVSPVSTA